MKKSSFIFALAMVSGAIISCNRQELTGIDSVGTVTTISADMSDISKVAFSEGEG